MISNQTYNKLIIISISCTLLLLVLGIIYVLQFNYVKPIGVYVYGPDSNSIEDVKLIMYDKAGKKVCESACFEHYRKDEKYIYEEWRHDLKKYVLADSLIISFPKDLFPEIETFWVKYGDIVTKFNRLNIEKAIIDNKEMIVFPAGSYIYQRNSLADAFRSLRFTKSGFVPIFRKLILGFLLLFIVSLLLRFWKWGISQIKKCSRFLIRFYAKSRIIIRPVLAFVLGLVFVFILLEITLRIIGFIHENKHNKNQSVIIQNTNPLIICAGDSFTESFGATQGKDYPTQLGQLIETNDSICDFNVLNFGKSGKNSAQVLLEVPVYLEKHKPKFLVLLIGSANYWNYWGYGGKERVWDRLKTVQFFKLLFNNISYRKNRNYFNQYDYIQRRITYSNYGIDTNLCNSKTLKILKTEKEEQVLSYVDSLVSNSLLSDSVALDLIMYGLFSGRKIEGMEDYLENYEPSAERARFYYNFIKAIMNDLDFNLSSISKPYAALYIYLNELKEQKFTEENLRKCLEYDPYFEDAYYQLYLISDEKISTPEDFLAKSWSFNDTIEFYRHRYGLTEASLNFRDVYITEDNNAKTKIKESNAWVEEDLINIYNICKENGTMLVLMNYPILHQGAIYYPVDKVIRDLANRNGILFVDHESIFDTINDNRNSYFISDGHCSDKGYELMAKNVYNMLLKNNLLEIEKASDDK